MNFNFGEVLTRAWQIIWKHKVLWIFGVLAGCGQGQGGGGGGGGNTGFEAQGPNIELPPEVMRWIQTIQDNLMTVIVVGISLLCLFWIIAIFLSTIGRIGLIRGAFQAEEGAERLILGQLFSESMPYFWRMFGLSLIIAIPILIVLAVLFAGLIAFAISASGGDVTATFGFVAMVPFIIGCACLLVPVMFVVGMIIRQAERAIVLEDMPLLPAIRRGWDVFTRNLGPIILMAIILIVLGLAVGFVIALPVVFIVIPAAFATALGQAQSGTPMVFAAVCLCLYVPVLLVLNGVLTAYTETAWTLTYMRLSKPQDNPPVVLEANA